MSEINNNPCRLLVYEENSNINLLGMALISLSRNIPRDKERTDWNIIWDHYPEYALRTSHETPYYDGIIGRIKLSTFKETKRHNIPVVNTWYSNSLKKLPSVLIDYNEAGKLAADHLIERGVRNFIVFDHDKNAASKDFLKVLPVD
jgi:hypothetical protein